MTAFLAVFTILLFTPLGSMVSSAITFLLPAYYTFKALESTDKKDDQRMLTFWISFGFVYLFDNLFSWIFSIFYFYHLLRSILLMYLFIPKYDGATKLYEKVIKPLFNKYHTTIN